MNEHVQTFVFSGLAFAIGMGVGQVIAVRRAADHHLTLGFEPMKVQVLRQIAWIVVVVMFFASVLQLVTFTYEQRQCNRDLLDTIRIRGEITEATKNLNDDRNQALSDLVQDLIAAQGHPDAWERVQAALADYRDTNEQLNKASDAQDRVRRDNPYPRCF